MRETEKQHETVQTDIAQHHAKVLKLEADITVLEEQLGDLRHTDPAGLTARVHAAQTQLEEAQTAQAHLEKRRGQEAELQQDAVQATAERESVEAALREALVQQGQQEGLVRARAEHIPEALRDFAALATAMTEAEEHLQALAQALEQARVQTEQAQRDLAVQEATLQSAQATVHSARQRATEAQQMFTRRLHEAGFADAADFQAACLDAPTLAQLEDESSATPVTSRRRVHAANAPRRQHRV